MVQDGALLDMYARADITMLARDNSYQRLQVEDMTVHTALSLAAHASSRSHGWQPPTHTAIQEVLPVLQFSKEPLHPEIWTYTKLLEKRLLQYSRTS